MKSSLYRNKKSNLVKKAYELSVLCNVPVCILIYPSINNIQQQLQLQEAEVFAFEGGDHTRPATESDPATVSKLAGEIVGRYLAYPNKDANNRKRSLNLSDMEVARKKFRAQQEVAFDTSNYKNNKSADISELSVDQLVELLGNLDNRIDYVRRRIDMIMGRTNNNVMVPTFMMGINDKHGHHHHGLMGVDYDGEFADHQVGQDYYDQTHQGPGFANGFGGVYNNMNMVGPNFYDQGSRFGADNLDDKINYVRRRIDMIEGTNNNVMVPASMMGISDNHDHHHHGLMGVDYGGEFADDQVGPMIADYDLAYNNMNLVDDQAHQGPGFADGFGGVYTNNMNMVGPNSYDQGSRFGADDLFSQSVHPVMMFDNQILIGI